MKAPTLVRTTLYLLLLQLSVSACPSAALAFDALSPTESVARLNHAGFRTRAHCSAFAIEGWGLVTAAHCLPDIDTDTVHILFAYNKGGFSQHLRTSGRTFRRVEDRDIAVLCDDTDKQSGLPLSRSDPASGLEVSVIGYGSPRVHVQQSYKCSVDTVSDLGVGTLDCPLPAGMSGAPIITAKGGEVIGVVSASGQRRSLFSNVDARILEQVCG